MSITKEHMLTDMRYIILKDGVLSTDGEDNRDYIKLDHECGICQEKVQTAKSACRLMCSHVYHMSCLSKWALFRSLKDEYETCPMCREIFSGFDVFPSLTKTVYEYEDILGHEDLFRYHKVTEFDCSKDDYLKEVKPRDTEETNL